MKYTDVTVVRIYITESSKLLEKIVDYLKNEAKISGVSVFRAISGFGDTVHNSSLIDLSINLPLVIEFFDKKNKVKPAVKYISSLVKPEHIIFWDAQSVI